VWTGSVSAAAYAVDLGKQKLANQSRSL